MTPLKPGDRVRHHTGIEGTLAKQHVPQWWTVHWDEYVRAITHHEDTFTPLGEPMNKTFRSVIQDPESARTLEVGDSMSGKTIHLSIKDGDPLVGIFLANEDAPAVVLAILEAAGVVRYPAESFGIGTDEHLRDIAYELGRYVGVQEEKAKESADREALEAEALRLHDAWRSELHNMTTTAWGELGDSHRAAWIGVARAARAVREITGVTA